ncbi:YbhB/YbcL family Raf kinase inhibitor-like protein [Mycobacterium sp. URHD0025]|uniref:YbhB/YbcL family Raf kinase inhibitor-like protein n=1 Tax=Mycobacterium sp. URHD0025 TaxID=1298864 RepID=UPI00049220C7|nr:YbhB/YbcL family Raf kinase inhibitor-like protein [Mycobacterium sp. URHD0025]
MTALPELIGKALRPVRAGRDRSRLAALTPVRTIELSSPAFNDGGALPVRFAGKGVGDNVSPPLRWAGVPERTAALVLIIEDEDVPLPRPLMHTVAVLDPSLDHLDEGSLQPGTTGLRFIKTMLGYGYSGPRPIPGHGVHHYRFYLFAVGSPVPDAVTTIGGVTSVIRDSVTARGVLTGSYQQ